jgi:hypothetical protein
MATTTSSRQIERSHGRHHSGLRFDCPYRDAFAGATEEALPPFHILAIDREQLGTSAPCSQGNQNIMGVITQGNLAIAARIRGHHLTGGIEILRAPEIPHAQDPSAPELSPRYPVYPRGFVSRHRAPSTP